MSGTKFHVDVRFASQKAFERGEPDDWIMAIEGAILVSAERSGSILYEDREAGRIHALSIMTTQAANDHQGLCDVF